MARPTVHLLISCQKLGNASPSMFVAIKFNAETPSPSAYGPTGVHRVIAIHDKFEGIRHDMLVGNFQAGTNWRQVPNRAFNYGPQIVNADLGALKRPITNSR